MFEDIKKLKKLLKLKEKDESQIRIEGFTLKELEDTIKKRQDEISGNINGLGWLLMFLIVIPLALTALGVSMEAAGLTSYFSAAIIFMFILPKITGRRY